MSLGLLRALALMALLPLPALAAETSKPSFKDMVWSKRQTVEAECGHIKHKTESWKGWNWTKEGRACAERVRKHNSELTARYYDLMQKYQADEQQKLDGKKRDLEPKADFRFSAKEVALLKRLQEQREIAEILRLTIGLSPLVQGIGSEPEDLAIDLLTTSWDELAAALEDVRNIYVCRSMDEIQHVVLLDDIDPDNVQKFWRPLISTLDARCSG